MTEHELYDLAIAAGWKDPVVVRMGERCVVGAWVALQEAGENVILRSKERAVQVRGEGATWLLAATAAGLNQGSTLVSRKSPELKNALKMVAKPGAVIFDGKVLGMADVPKDKYGEVLWVGDRVLWQGKESKISFVYPNSAGTIDCRVVQEGKTEEVPVHGSFLVKAADQSTPYAQGEPPSGQIPAGMVVCGTFGCTEPKREGETFCRKCFTEHADDGDKAKGGL